MSRVVSRSQPLLRKSDFRAYLESSAKEMAPRDVEVLLSQAAGTRAKALTAPHPRMGPQMALALDLLADHAAGRCPQISFYTVSLLAEAVYYFIDPNGVIPDWIPEIGRLDDALVLELAFELGADGIGRYCTWKDIDLEKVYGPNKATATTSQRPQPRQRKAAAKKRRPAKKKRATKTVKKRAAAAKKSAKKAVKRRR